MTYIFHTRPANSRRKTSGQFGSSDEIIKPMRPQRPVIRATVTTGCSLHIRSFFGLTRFSCHQGALSSGRAIFPPWTDIIKKKRVTEQLKCSPLWSISRFLLWQTSFYSGFSNDEKSKCYDSTNNCFLLLYQFQPLGLMSSCKALKVDEKVVLEGNSRI